MGRIVSGVGRVVPAATLAARDEATALLADARAAAAAIRAQAAEAHDEAVRQGREQGRAEAAAEMAALMVDTRGYVARIHREMTTGTSGVIPLALKIAGKIVGRAVTLAPEVMAEIAGTALEASRPRGDWVNLRVHPDDAAAVTAQREALAARVPGGAALMIVADDSVSRYGCIVETAVGRVDARLETQLAALERALTEPTHG